MNAIAIVTTCKGRLHHLRETLPLMAAQGADEVVVVDYACPDGAGDWVAKQFPDVRVVRVDDDPGFCLPRARNLGAATSTADWIAFVDADVKLSPGWIDWVRANARPGRFYRAGPVGGVRRPDTFGTIVCARRDFDAAGGYDEAMRGWGGEDLDLYARLAQAGAADSEYPGHLVDAIAHGDQQRTRWHAVKDTTLQSVVNQCYLAAKYQVAAFRGPQRPLDLETRTRLLDQTRRQVSAWNGDTTKPLTLKYTVTGADWLPAPYAMRKQMQLTIEVGVRREAGLPPEAVPRPTDRA